MTDKELQRILEILTIWTQEGMTDHEAIRAVYDVVTEDEG